MRIETLFIYLTVNYVLSSILFNSTVQKIVINTPTCRCGGLRFYWCIDSFHAVSS